MFIGTYALTCMTLQALLNDAYGSLQKTAELIILEIGSSKLNRSGKKKYESSKLTNYVT